MPPEAKAFLKSQVGGILPQWGSWGFPSEAEAFLNHKLSDIQLETFQPKNVGFYHNGGQGTCSLEAKAGEGFKVYM